MACARWRSWWRTCGAVPSDRAATPRAYTRERVGNFLAERRWDDGAFNTRDYRWPPAVLDGDGLAASRGRLAAVGRLAGPPRASPLPLRRPVRAARDPQGEDPGVLVCLPQAPGAGAQGLPRTQRAPHPAAPGAGRPAPAGPGRRARGPAGGRPMRAPTPPCCPAVPPAQVWAGLSPELRERAVRLLARLACAQATTAPVTPLKEVSHALPPGSGQDSSHPS